jgi:hypothetical protein
VYFLVYLLLNSFYPQFFIFRICCKAKKKRFVFPVACLKIIWLVGRLSFFFSFCQITIVTIVSSKQKIRVSAKKMGSVGQPETQLFFLAETQPHTHCFTAYYMMYVVQFLPDLCLTRDIHCLRILADILLTSVDNMTILKPIIFNILFHWSQTAIILFLMLFYKSILTLQPCSTLVVNLRQVFYNFPCITLKQKYKTLRKYHYSDHQCHHYNISSLFY